MYFTLTDASDLSFTGNGSTQTVSFSTYNNMRLSICGDTLAISVKTGSSTSTKLTTYSDTFDFIVSTVSYDGTSYPCVIYTAAGSSSSSSNIYFFRTVYLYSDYSDLRNADSTFYIPYANSAATTVNNGYGTLLAQMVDPLLDAAAVDNVYIPIFASSESGTFTLNGAEYMNLTYLCIGGE